MKKYIIILITLFFIPLTVFAQNHIYSIDMNIYINEDGSANVTEDWDVKGEDGSEWYKLIPDVNNETLSDFIVRMDGQNLKYKDWNIDESLEDKKGYYGINYNDNGLELCFGKYDYERHNFSLSYKLKEFIVNTEDSQILYWTLINTIGDFDFDQFTINVESYYKFPDTLDVWGFGNKGYAYVSNGIISMSNEENTNMNGQYAVLLAKFPLETFKTNVKSEKYNTFDDVLNAAKEGSYKHNYDNEDDENFNFYDYLIIAVPIIFVLILLINSIIKSNKDGYGYRDNKKINKNNTNMYRDIPCNKNIYLANTLTYLNNFDYDYKNSNILGTIILKWVKEDKIGFITEKKGVFNKDTSSLDLTKKPTFEDHFEKRVFDMLYEASNDGILQNKELEKWCRKHYEEFTNLFENKLEDDVDLLREQGHITHSVKEDNCKKINIMDDYIYEESQKLYGLKLFLKEFSEIEKKEVMEVKIWDEYLMFAYIFGMAKEVADQLKKLYPEVWNNMGYDYDTIVFVHYVSYNSSIAASAARSAAENYSSGGGGFSFGGGGGGSFGSGGGIGSR